MMELDDGGWAPIHHAAYDGLLAKIERFVDFMEEISNLTTSNEGVHREFTPLMCAALGGQYDAVHLLLKLGADVTHSSLDGRTVVDIVIDNFHPKMFKLFACSYNDTLRPFDYLVKLLTDTNNEKRMLAAAKLTLHLSTDNEELINDMVVSEDVRTEHETYSRKSEGKGTEASLKRESTSTTEASEINATVKDESLSITEENSEANLINNNQKNMYSWEHLLESDILSAFEKIITSTQIECEVKLITAEWFANLMNNDKVQEQFIKKNGVKLILQTINLIHSENQNEFPLLTWFFQILKIASNRQDGLKQLEKARPIKTLLRSVDNASKHEILDNIIGILNDLLKVHPEFKEEISKYGLKGIVKKYSGCNHMQLIQSLNRFVQITSIDHVKNQNEYVLTYDLSPRLIAIVVKSRNRDIQLSSVKTLQYLAEDNPKCQKRLIEMGCIPALIGILKSRQARVQLISTAALFAITGNDRYRRRALAKLIGVSLFLDYMTQNIDELSLMAAEGLSLLAEGPNNQSAAIGREGGILQLVRLLRSEREDLVIAAIRTLRKLCVSTGFIPNTKIQDAIFQARGGKPLLIMMKHGKTPQIQIECGLTLSYMALGRPNFFKEFDEEPYFSYAPLMKLLRETTDLRMRCKILSALAIFSYRNVAQQKEISEYKMLRYHQFVPLLNSDKDIEKINASFQTIILSRMLPDIEPAECSAKGIQILVNTLETCREPYIQVFAADCVSRLYRAGNGIPEAIIAIDGIRYLCNLVHSPDEHVQGTAAISLGFLSCISEGERRLLKICRRDPEIVKTILSFCRNRQISSTFEKEWRHYTNVGLPTKVVDENSRMIEEITASCMESIKDMNREPSPSRAASVSSFADRSLGTKSYTRTTFKTDKDTLSSSLIPSEFVATN